MTNLTCPLTWQIATIAIAIQADVGGLAMGL